MPRKHSSGFKNNQKQIKILALHVAKVNSASAESSGATDSMKYLGEID
jgi:hypothetical protein